MVGNGSVDVLTDIGGGVILGLFAGFLPVEDNVSVNDYFVLLSFNQLIPFKIITIVYLFHSKNKKLEYERVLFQKLVILQKLN